MNEIYFAGLIDGEGCISIKRHPPRNGGITNRHVLNLSIEMADPRPIKAFCDFFGLNVTYNTTRHRKNPAKHRYLFVAHMGVKKSIKILEKLLPHLIAKKAEAILAIEFHRECFAKHNHWAVGRARKPVPKQLLDLRDKYYHKMRALKHQSFERYRPQSS